MCLFTFANKNALKARAKGVERFECGGCPECLQKKARQWALRCGMEARSNVGMMITLTYDTYKNGKDGEENSVDTSLTVSKEHCQRFMKRLRKHYPDKQIKYLITAEYGKRTHRAHYHALIFGVVFNDLRRYKTSSRGNIIYKSPTLEKIWSADKQHNGGICTVDCINVSAKTARYCTKYCAKDYGVDDTFMLFSRGIGEEMLLKKFNGLSYWVDGREYSIPRVIWNRFIENKYSIKGYSRYVNKVHLFDIGKSTCHKLDRLSEEDNQQRENIWKSYIGKVNNLCKAHDRQAIRREIFAFYRDNDYLYKRYLYYWRRKNEVCEVTRPSEYQRILALPDKKYRSYKCKAIRAKVRQTLQNETPLLWRGVYDFIPPRSNCQGFCENKVKKVYEEKSFAPLSRHYRANDTNKTKSTFVLEEIRPNKPYLIPYDGEENPFAVVRV